MQNYVGQECPVCHKKFVEADDIVVCPECGAPHHRDCYRQEGHCYYEREHQKGFAWRPEEAPPPPKPGIGDQKGERYCIACGRLNPPGTIRCEQCGADLSDIGRENPQYRQRPTNVQDAYHQMMRDFQADMMNGSEIDGVSVQDIAIFVGKNPVYFVNVFRQLFEKIRSMIFNWPALIFSFFYFFYRKMYKAGILVLLLNILVWLPSFLLVKAVLPQAFPQAYSDPTIIYTFAYDFTGLERLAVLAQTANYVKILIALLCGMFANKIYMRHTISTVKKIRDARPDASLEEYRYALARTGRTSAGGAVLIGVILLIALFLVSSTAIPSM